MLLPDKAARSQVPGDCRVRVLRAVQGVSHGDLLALGAEAVSLQENASLAMTVARQRVKARRLMGHPAAVLSLWDLVAFAWLCGAIDAIQAQSKAEAS